MTAQGVMVTLMMINLILVGIMDGKPRDDNWSLSKALLNAIITVSILWWGGFWEPLLR